MATVSPTTTAFDGAVNVQVVDVEEIAVMFVAIVALIVNVVELGTVAIEPERLKIVGLTPETVML